MSHSNGVSGFHTSSGNQVAKPEKFIDQMYRIHTHIMNKYVPSEGSQNNVHACTVKSTFTLSQTNAQIT